MTEESVQSILPAFHAAWTDGQSKAAASPELLPVMLTRACVAVLPVDGAGLSLHDDDFRVPVGASDDVATAAERLQFTQGEGPCIDAAGQRRILVASTSELVDRWPSFSDELFRQTPYRGIVSVPLALTSRAYGALDLYVVDPRRMAELRLDEVSAVCGEIVDAMRVAADVRMASADAAAPGERDSAGEVLPVWLITAPAEARAFVWVAMGMVISEFNFNAGDALALLRSFAYGRGQTVDAVAADVVSGELRLSQLQA